MTDLERPDEWPKAARGWMLPHLVLRDFLDEAVAELLDYAVPRQSDFSPTPASTSIMRIEQWINQEHLDSARQRLCAGVFSAGPYHSVVLDFLRPEKLTMLPRD